METYPIKLRVMNMLNSGVNKNKISSVTLFPAHFKWSVYYSMDFMMRLSALF
jgi:hypothetical protein